MQLFDRSLYAQRRQRSGEVFSQVDFLHVQAQERIIDRLDVMKRHFANVLVLGAPDNTLMHHQNIGQCMFADIAPARLPSNVQSRVVLDEEWLPCLPNSLDAIVSVLTLHHCNDIAGVLVQMQRALKPDGLLLAVVPGVRSLMSLRRVLAESEARAGGMSPRMTPFMDVRDAGALLQRCGFALPVVDSEMLYASYHDVYALMNELRVAGEANILSERLKHFSSRTFFMNVFEHYPLNAEQRIDAAFELVCLTGWVPHPDQQQPAKRGSGQMHFDAINTLD